MYTEQHNPNKVIVPREEVAEFVDARPNCGLQRNRSYWFEFDEGGGEIDSDVPVQDEGGGAAELSWAAWVWLEDNGPLLRDGVERALAAQHIQPDAATPGPWRVGDNVPDNDTSILADFAGHPTTICECFNHARIGRNDDKANARLIAAAPDLLEALRLVLEHAEWIAAVHVGTPPPNSEFARRAKMARAAIAKATDGAS